jgi:SAM-dependent methyltransferase
VADPQLADERAEAACRAADLNRDPIEGRATACPVCAGAISAWRSKTGEGVVWSIDRCKSCGFGFVNPRPNLAYLMDFYEGTASIAQGPQTLADVLADERASPNSSIDAAAMLDRIGRLLPATSGRRFLDVGSGYGFFTAAALARGFTVDAIELGSVQRRISVEMTGVVPAAVAFEAFSPSGPAYDVILMSQILEHAHDIGRWLEKCRELLSMGGILAIALPNFDSLACRVLREREPFICPPEHLNFFAADSLSRLVAAHGFSVEATEWITRVPKSAFARRLPGALQPLVPVLDAAAGLVTRGVDAMQLGSVLRLYARKTG